MKITQLQLFSIISIFTPESRAQFSSHVFKILQLNSFINNKLEYEISLNFILMKIENKENIHYNKIVKEIFICNRNFYFKAKQLELKFIFIHINKN